MSIQSMSLSQSLQLSLHEISSQSRIYLGRLYQWLANTRIVQHLDSIETTLVVVVTAFTILKEIAKLFPTQDGGRPLSDIQVDIRHRYDNFMLTHPRVELGSATILTTHELAERFQNWYARNAADAPHIDMENLGYRPIPNAHHNDATLGTFICPLTMCPIRFPVTVSDSTDGPDHHFERDAIVEWLLKKKVNPMNKEPLHLRDLRENYEMRAIIEGRMTALGIPL